MAQNRLLKFFVKLWNRDDYQDTLKILARFREDLEAVLGLWRQLAGRCIAGCFGNLDVDTIVDREEGARLSLTSLRTMRQATMQFDCAAGEVLMILMQAEELLKGWSKHAAGREEEAKNLSEELDQLSRGSIQCFEPLAPLSAAAGWPKHEPGRCVTAWSGRTKTLTALTSVWNFLSSPQLRDLQKKIGCHTDCTKAATLENSFSSQKVYAYHDHGSEGRDFWASAFRCYAPTAVEGEVQKLFDQEVDIDKISSRSFLIWNERNDVAPSDEHGPMPNVLFDQWSVNLRLPTSLKDQETWARKLTAVIRFLQAAPSRPVEFVYHPGAINLSFSTDVAARETTIGE